MSDTIGRITVPQLVSSGLTFPLTGDQNYGFTQERPVIVHRFGSLDAKQEQRFEAGIGPRKFAFRRQHLSIGNRNVLAAFWENVQGAGQSFIYNVPNADQTTTPTTVTWEYAPLSIQYLVNACQVGFNFVEVPASTAAYSVTATCTRFPSSALSTALLSEVQQIVPLVHIRPREAAVPDIWLSDRRVTLSDGAGGAVQTTMGWAASSQSYLPRLIGMGEPGSDVLISQDLKGSSDNVKLAFGNADRVMTALANDTDLKYASIDLCLFHVNTGILIRVWKGVIQNFKSDGTAVFPVTCSDGFFQMFAQYPARTVSHQCWKPYNDGLNCPWATEGASSAAVTAAGGDPASCDYYLESTNGCQVHGMSPYFGGHQVDPQGAIIKDDSTGFLGFGRNRITATSIISETPFGLALPEIWCNSGGNPLFAFMAKALMMAYRDESGYADSLGILGAGPLGGFSQSAVAQNQDGYRFVVAPTVDGYTWQGFQVDGNYNVTKDQAGYGLRNIVGNDPVNPSTDYFSLGQGSPQVWEADNYAAGTAGCEVRIVKSTTIQPSTPDEHQMTVPLDYGMWGWVWDQHGNRSAVAGLINPFWIVVNMLLRALGLYGNPAAGTGPSSATQLAAFVLASLIVGDGSGAAEIAAAQVTPVLSIASGSSLASITVDTPGALYSANVSVSIQNGGGLGAAAVANLVNTTGAGDYYYVDSITLTSSGYGFTEPPDIVITDNGGSGSGATATAVFATPPDTETQFQFQGVVAEQKPFGAWLTEVLNCAVGFYTWEFGQLKLGCRINASAVDAYTLANMLFQSLSLSPIPAAVEHLTISFADVAYQYQANTAEYSDKSHAAYYGRAGNPLSGDMHLVGCSTLSQGCRIAATRVREELGGVTAWEWRNARAGAWQTTLLGLGNEVGQVISMTHPEVPGVRGICNVSGATATWVSGDPWTYAGTATGDPELINKVILIGGSQVTITAVASNGSTITTSPAPPSGSGQAFHVITMNFRLQKWSLKKDWSVQLEGQTVTASMYDLEVGPQPTSIAPSPLPALRAPAPMLPYPWRPAVSTFGSADAFWPNQDSFSLGVDTSAYPAQLTVFGATPVNTPSTGSRPSVPMTATSSSAAGGAIAAGTYFFIFSGSASGPISFSVTATVPSGAANTVTISGIVWPNAAQSAIQPYVGTSSTNMRAAASGSYTSGSPDANGNPTSFTFTSITPDGPGLPDANVAAVEVTEYTISAPGIWVDTVTAVDSTGKILTLQNGGAWTVNGWMARILSLYYRPNVTPQPGLNMAVSGNAAGTLTMPATGFLVGDVVVLRFKPSAITSNSISDSGMLSFSYGAPGHVSRMIQSRSGRGSSGGGMTVNAYIGGQILFIKGTGAGSPPSTIASNTASAFTIVGTWPVEPDLTSVFIVIVANPVAAAPPSAVSNDGSQAGTALISISAVPQTQLQMLLLSAATVDAEGNALPLQYQPFRECAVPANASPGITLQIDGTLAIGSNQAPIVALSTTRTPSAAAVYMKTAPTGSSGATFNINVGGTLWMTLTVPAGSTTAAATSAQLTASGALAAGENITLDVTAVGTTVPGADVSIFIYF
jgi:hypothetical protein